MNRGRKSQSPLQRLINESLCIPWVPPIPMDQVIECFWARVDTSGGEEACWRWTGPPMTQGYGQLMVQGRHWTTHTFAYHVTNFGVEVGLQIDHVCHNDVIDCLGGSSCPHRLCCNPRHLEAVAPAVNQKRAAEPRGRLKDHCPRGHLKEGILTHQTGPRAGQQRRYCLVCYRENVDRIKAART